MIWDCRSWYFNRSSLRDSIRMESRLCWISVCICSKVNPSISISSYRAGSSGFGIVSGSQDGGSAFGRKASMAPDKVWIRPEMFLDIKRITSRVAGRVISRVIRMVRSRTAMLPVI